MREKETQTSETHEDKGCGAFKSKVVDQVTAGAMYRSCKELTAFERKLFLTKSIIYPLLAILLIWALGYLIGLLL